MKINIKSVPVIVVDYMEKHILPKASGWQKFAVGSAMFVAHNRAAQIVENLEILKMLELSGVLKGEELDMDYLHDMALSALEKSGGKLKLMGYVMDNSDVEEIYKIAKNLEVES